MTAQGTGDGDVLSVDALTRRTMAELLAEPGVHRVGLALTEGGGRRLRFTASDRAGTSVEWCHIDAYDDVPLTTVVRTGERVAGTLIGLEALFPDYVRGQEGSPTVALLAVPLVAAGQVLGGIVLFLDREDALGSARRDRLTTRAGLVGAELRRAQLRSPRTGSALTDEPAGDGVVVFGCTVEGDPRAVGTARRFLRHALAAQGLDEELVDTAVLCLSEIVTNAVIHTHAPSELRVTLDDGVLTIVLRDQGSHRGDRPGPRSEDDPLRVHGRGLQLLAALAARWGSELDSVGTTVWFVL